MSGMVVRKFGTRRTVSVMAIVVVTGIAVAGVGSEISPMTVGAGLLLTGFGMGLSCLRYSGSPTIPSRPAHLEKRATQP